jgi:hypothetical protein
MLSGFESRHLSKLKIGRNKQKSNQHTLARQKYKKKTISVLLRSESTLVVVPAPAFFKKKFIFYAHKKKIMEEVS